MDCLGLSEMGPHPISPVQHQGSSLTQIEHNSARLSGEYSLKYSCLKEYTVTDLWDDCVIDCTELKTGFPGYARGTATTVASCLLPSSC